MKGLASITHISFLDKFRVVVLFLPLLGLIWIDTIHLNSNPRVLMDVENTLNSIAQVLLWVAHQLMVVPDETCTLQLGWIS